VWFGKLAPMPREDSLNALGVLFEPGARTDWHTHPDGQVLYIVSGAGFVVREDGEVAAVSAGDAVFSPAGEVHWHGATPHSYMMHLSLTTGGPTEWTGEKVTDSEYEQLGGRGS
jgi:quercetin dioxygenase-like cupin family protein